MRLFRVFLDHGNPTLSQPSRPIPAVSRTPVFLAAGSFTDVLGISTVGYWIVGVTSFQKIYGLYSVNIIKWRNGHMRWVVGGFCGYVGSVWVMGEWAVSQWIVGVTSFQKI